MTPRRPAADSAAKVQHDDAALVQPWFGRWDDLPASFALACRRAALCAGNERIAFRAAAPLGQRVGEFTHELSGALRRLGVARDGLPGVLNRRHFEPAFAPLPAQRAANATASCRDPQRPGQRAGTAFPHRPAGIARPRWGWDGAGLAQDC